MTGNNVQSAHMQLAISIPPKYAAAHYLKGKLAPALCDCYSPNSDKGAGVSMCGREATVSVPLAWMKNAPESMFNGNAAKMLMQPKTNCLTR